MRFCSLIPSAALAAVLLAGCAAESEPDAPGESTTEGVDAAVTAPEPGGGGGLLLVGGDLFTPHASCALLPLGRVAASISVSATEDSDVLLFIEGRTDGTGSAEIWMADDSAVYSEYGTWDAEARQLRLSDFGLIVDASGAVLGSGTIHSGNGDMTVQVQAVC